MYTKPSTRRIKRKPKPLNLVPILDAVFILIFYLLMSAQFFKTFQVGSEYPLASNQPPPKKVKKSLNLKINIGKDKVQVITGVEEKMEREFATSSISSLILLNKFLAGKKKQYPKENTAIVVPENDVNYKIIIKVLDYIRTNFTLEEDTTLFNELVIGNIDSKE